MTRDERERWQRSTSWGSSKARSVDRPSACSLPMRLSRPWSKSGAAAFSEWDSTAAVLPPAMLSGSASTRVSRPSRHGRRGARSRRPRFRLPRGHSGACGTVSPSGARSALPERSRSSPRPGPGLLCPESLAPADARGRADERRQSARRRAAHFCRWPGRADPLGDTCRSRTTIPSRYGCSPTRRRHRSRSEIVHAARTVFLDLRNLPRPHTDQLFAISVEPLRRRASPLVPSS